MKILGQSRSDRWYQELLRKSGGEDNDLLCILAQLIPENIQC